MFGSKIDSHKQVAKPIILNCIFESQINKSGLTRTFFHIKKKLDYIIFIFISIETREKINENTQKQKFNNT